MHCFALSCSACIVLHCLAVLALSCSTCNVFQCLHCLALSCIVLHCLALSCIVLGTNFILHSPSSSTVRARVVGVKAMCRKPAKPGCRPARLLYQSPNSLVSGHDRVPGRFINHPIKLGSYDHVRRLTRRRGDSKIQIIDLGLILNPSYTI